jgi:hypothetical protein
MRLIRPRFWVRYLLAWIALIVVIGSWLSASIVATAIRWPRKALLELPPGQFRLSVGSPQLWLRLGAAMVLASWFVVWLLFAITYPIHPLLTFASIPVWTYLLLLIVQGPEYPDPFEEIYAGTPTWPSHVSRWPDPVGRLPFEKLTGLSQVCRPPMRNVAAVAEELTRGRDIWNNRNRVREHVSGLVQDWLTGNAWKYRLVGVWLPEKTTRTPFGAVPEWWKVYQIALEDPIGLVRYGWIRFGDGKVAFQFEADGQQDAFLRDPFDPGRAARELPPEPLRFAVGPDPLWDRWIDG